jgi:hypothetical protein
MYLLHDEVPIAIPVDRVPLPIPAPLGGWISRHEPSEGLGLSQAAWSLRILVDEWIPVLAPTLVVIDAPPSGSNLAGTTRDGTEVNRGQESQQAIGIHPAIASILTHPGLNRNSHPEILPRVGALSYSVFSIPPSAAPPHPDRGDQSPGPWQ